MPQHSSSLSNERNRRLAGCQAVCTITKPIVGGGLPEILPSLLTAFNNPFHIELCEDSLKTVLVLLLCYAMGIGIYFSTQKNYRRREEHGSEKWGNARAVNKKYRQSPASANKLMTQNVCIGLNAKKHRRNLNTLVCLILKQKIMQKVRYEP